MLGGAIWECGIVFPGVSISRDPSRGITVCTAPALFAPEPLEWEMFGKAADPGARCGNPAGSAPAAFLEAPGPCPISFIPLSLPGLGSSQGLGSWKSSRCQQHSQFRNIPVLRAGIFEFPRQIPSLSDYPWKNECIVLLPMEISRINWDQVLETPALQRKRT